MYCETCEDSGTVSEFGEVMVSDPGAKHGHRIKEVAQEVVCPDCPACVQCGKHLAKIDAYSIPIKTYDGAPLDLAFCTFECLDRHLRYQSPVTRLVILGMIMHWWSIHEDGDMELQMTICITSRIADESTSLLKGLCE